MKGWKVPSFVKWMLLLVVAVLGGALVGALILGLYGYLTFEPDPNCAGLFCPASASDEAWVDGFDTLSSGRSSAVFCGRLSWRLGCGAANSTRREGRPSRVGRIVRVRTALKDRGRRLDSRGNGYSHRAGRGMGESARPPSAGVS